MKAIMHEGGVGEGKLGLADADNNIVYGSAA
jgi:hypothetical protein